MADYEPPTAKKIRNLSRGSGLSVSSSVSGPKFQGFSNTLTNIASNQAKAQAISKVESDAKVKHSEDMASLGKMVGIGNFGQQDLQAVIAESSRKMQKHGIISATENFFTIDAVDEDRTKARLTAIADNMKSNGSIQRMSNPDPRFRSDFDRELRSSMLSVGGTDFSNDVASDSQGNPVGLDINAMSTQEKLLFSKATIAHRRATEKAVGQIMDKRSIEASRTRGKQAVYEGVSRLNKSLAHSRNTAHMGQVNLTPFGPPVHPLTGRNIFTDEEGREYTEKSITIEVDGKWVNVPSIDTNTGESFGSNMEAYDAAVERDEAFRFDSKEEAIAAAKARSAQLGKARTPEAEDMRNNALDSLRHAYRSMYLSQVPDPQEAFLEALNSSITDLASSADPSMQSGNGIHDVNAILDMLESDSFSIRSNDSGPVAFAPAGTKTYDTLRKMRAGANKAWEDKRVAYDAAQPDLEKRFMLFAMREYRRLKEENGKDYFFNENNQAAFMDDLMELAISPEFGIANFSKIRTQITGVWELGKRDDADTGMSRGAKELQQSIYANDNSPEELGLIQQKLDMMHLNGDIGDSDHRTLSNEIQDRESKIRTEGTAVATQQSTALGPIKGYNRKNMQSAFRGYMRRMSPTPIDKDIELRENSEMVDDAATLQMRLRAAAKNGDNVQVDPGAKKALEALIVKLEGERPKPGKETLMDDHNKAMAIFNVYDKINGRVNGNLIVKMRKVLAGFDAEDPALYQEPLNKMESNSNRAASFLETYMEVSAALDIFAITETTKTSSFEKTAVQEVVDLWIAMDFSAPLALKATE